MVFQILSRLFSFRTDPIVIISLLVRSAVFTGNPRCELLKEWERASTTVHFFPAQAFLLDNLERYIADAILVMA